MEVSLLMTKKRKNGQQLEKPQFDFKVSETIHEETGNSELEAEIECPSCQKIVTLSAYDSPYYSCNECNFVFTCSAPYPYTFNTKPSDGFILTSHVSG